MGRKKAPAWTREETAVLREVYPAEGLNGVADLLPDRTWQAIYVMAHKLGLPAPPTAAPKVKLQGERLEEGIRLREELNWSFARIGAHFGIAEASACNAILIALCPRKGFTPAPRDSKGRLLPEGFERLRWMLRKGIKPVEIQLRLGVSAGRIAEERRRYNADLKARGKAALPPPGGGERYSGARISREIMKQVEDLILTGLGTPKVAARTGVSKVHCQRVRAKLLKRLKRKGQCIPGCDIDGHRKQVFEHSSAIPPSAIADLRRLLLERMPVIQAARRVGIGGSSAYRIRDELAAELAVRGEALLPPTRLGRSEEALRAAAEANWLPKRRRYYTRFRVLCREHGDVEGKLLMLAELEAERSVAADAAARERALAQAERNRPRTFEEQLARVAAGARIVTKIPLRRPDPTMTLGGIATAAL